MLRNYLTSTLQEKEAVNCYYALAKELEDLGENKQSFKALKSGAAIQRRLVDFNLAAGVHGLGVALGRTALVEGDLATQQPITVGATSITEVEILSGLEEGDTIIVSDTSRFQDAKSILLRN